MWWNPTPMSEIHRSLSAEAVLEIMKFTDSYALLHIPKTDFGYRLMDCVYREGIPTWSQAAELASHLFFL